jgi:hypothetical protein
MKLRSFILSVAAIGFILAAFLAGFLIAVAR